MVEGWTWGEGGGGSLNLLKWLRISICFSIQLVLNPLMLTMVTNTKAKMATMAAILDFRFFRFFRDILLKTARKYFLIGRNYKVIRKIRNKNMNLNNYEFFKNRFYSKHRKFDSKLNFPYFFIMTSSMLTSLN